ncbi:MAG: XTP/dITP diphosphatase [Thiohalomonadales bacterium]
MKNSKIVLASNNQGKVREISQMVKNLELEIVPQSDYNVSEIEETGLTFVENAILKARHASKVTGLPAIADDSGIEVDFLNGAPGIYSARYSGVGASDKDNLDKMLLALKDVPTEKRSARFQCLMVFMRHANDPTPFIAHGTWQGTITELPEGENGFGYDPVFYVKDFNCTSAQLPADTKNTLSHRGQALKKLITFFGDL